jgi:N4-gp56 family major capsid protein
MADTSFGVNDPLAVQVWGKKLYVEALRKTVALKFVGNGPDALIQVRDELNSGPGSKVTFGLRMQLNGAGVSGDTVLEGKEEELIRHTDSVQIDQLRHAVKVVGNMSQQRVPFNIRSEGESGLSDWWAGRIDTSLFNQLGGNTNQNGTGDDRYNYTGMQACVAPSATAGKTHWIYADEFTSGAYSGAGDTEAGMGAHTTNGTSTTQDAPYRLELIDRCVVKARTMSPPIRPLSLNGMECYAKFLHPHQVLQLRQNSTAGQWLDIQKAAMTGGLVSKNAVFTGALGMYNNTILHEAVRAPYGDDTEVGADTKTDLGAAANGTTAISRAIFCGAQSATMAFGRAYGWNGTNIRFKWTEVMNDYENQIGISAALVWGTKKAVFNSNDFGTIVASTVSPGV